MRRLFTIAAALLMCVVGVPAVAQAVPVMTLGSGSVLSNPNSPVTRECTAAFAATDGVTGYLIAGPVCPAGDLYSPKVGGGYALVGTVVNNPGTQYNGFSVVRVTNTTDWQLVPWVSDGTNRIVITGSAETPVGGRVCHVGPTIGSTCGIVEAKGLTVAFPWGTATGVTRTSICSPALGAAYLTDDQAQGVPLGGSACTGTGPSYFLPVNPILTAYRLRLVTG